MRLPPLSESAENDGVPYITDEDVHDIKRRIVAQARARWSLFSWIPRLGALYVPLIRVILSGVLATAISLVAVLASVLMLGSLCTIDLTVTAQPWLTDALIGIGNVWNEIPQVARNAAIVAVAPAILGAVLYLVIGSQVPFVEYSAALGRWWRLPLDGSLIADMPEEVVAIVAKAQMVRWVFGNLYVEVIPGVSCFLLVHKTYGIWARPRSLYLAHWVPKHLV